MSAFDQIDFRKQLRYFFSSIEWSYIVEASQMGDSDVIIHNYDRNIVEYLEISVPYMLMYERVNMKDNIFYLNVASEQEFSCYSMPYSELHVPERSQHFHDFYEFTIVLSGTLQLHVEDTVKTYHAGDMCFCNRRIRHRELYEGDCELILLMITHEMLLRILKKDVSYFRGQKPETYSHLFRDIITSSSFLQKKVYYDFTAKSPEATAIDDISACVLFILYALKKHGPGTSYLIKGRICELLAIFDHDRSYQISQHQLPANEREELFFEISTVFHETHGLISNAALVERLSYNSEYMNRVIKRHAGMTLTDYRRSFVLREAATLLADTNQSVAEISEALGYSNRTFFNRIFAEKYNMTPSEYRIRIAQMAAQND